MATLHTNLVSLFSHRSLASSQTGLSNSVERLSSGLRINRAKDDAAGLGISQELQRQTRSFAVASRNANDAISMVQTAEGALSSVSDMLIRMKELTVQGANDSLSKDQRSFIASELAQLRKEINAVAERTTFNSTKLLTGDFSEAVQGEFVKATKLDGTNRSVLGTSTVKLGVASEFIVDAQKSIMSVADLQVDVADQGKYSLSSDGAAVVLSRTVGNTTESQSITLVTGAATSSSQVALNNAVNGTMTLSFSDFGVSIIVKNDRIGTADRSVSEIATKIASIGVTPNENYKDQGWKTVSGADWASGAGTLKAVITSSGGQVRTTTTAGLTAVTGYAALGTSQLDATSGRYEMAFTGTAAQLNAALATLQIDNTTGLGEITVDILPDGMSVFTNPTNGVTSYYQVVTSNLTWNNARNAASLATFNGLTGYLTNVTSANEHSFIAAKVQGTAWIGAYEPTTDGTWVWADGPEGGQQFWSGGIGGSAVAVTANGSSTSYANWAPSQPDSGGILAGANLWDFHGYRWDDLLGPGASAWNGPSPATSPQYIIEYGGQTGVSANTSKTLLIGTPGFINVGDAVEVEGVNTTGVGTSSAEVGVYRLSADSTAKTVTLKRFDVDGETLLKSETISKPDGLGAGRYTSLSFEDLGVSLTVSNSADRSITLGDLESGLDKDLTVATSRMASLIGKDGPKFQTGVSSRNDLAVDAFKDMRMGKNIDGEHGSLFNDVSELILSMAADSDPTTASFQELESKVEDMIDVVSAQRSGFGAIQNRLTAAVNNISEQFINLSAAQSQILDTDFAAETARLTRMQIGQQASTAMLAQANQLPSVILALLQ